MDPIFIPPPKKNVFWAKNCRNSGKNKSHEFCLCITYSFGSLYLLPQEPGMNIIDYQFNLTSWSLFFIEKDKKNNIRHISHVVLCLFTDA